MLKTGIVLVALLLSLQPVHTQPAGRNVIVVTLDGFRWQEMFTGASREYFKREAGGEPGAAEKRFWRSTPEERRAALLPFVWGTVAAAGQVFGDPAKRSSSRLTNGLWFSYPGYSEMFAGIADPNVDSNDKVPNPNITVLEWLNGRPGFRGRVAAFGAWDVLPSILNVERSRIPVGAAFTPVPSPANARSASWPRTCRPIGATGRSTRRSCTPRSSASAVTSRASST